MKYYKITPESNDKKIIVEETYSQHDGHGNENIVITLKETYNTGHVVIKFDDSESIDSYNVDGVAEDGNFAVADSDKHYHSHTGADLVASEISGTGVDNTQLQNDFSTHGKDYIVSTYGPDSTHGMPMTSVFKISGNRVATDVSSDY